jgi:hypothetical protein
MGPLAAKSLTVVARRPGGSWRVMAGVHTRSDGSYAVKVRPRGSATWLVRWTGVVSSQTEWVPVTTR